MKNAIFTIAFMLLATCALVAQTQSFNYQGVARDNGTPVNGTIGLELSILAGGPTGTVVYQEEQSPTTNSYGVFDVEVGGPNAVVTQGNFSTINWGEGNFFLQVGLDVNGGANFTNMGSTRITSVPMAIQAISSSLLEDADHDTKIQVEENGDDDQIRFDLGGSERALLKRNANGFTQLELPNSDNNILIGFDAGQNITNAYENIIIGLNAGKSNETGNSNILIGARSGESAINHFSNTFVGNNTGRLVNGSGDNTFIGSNAGEMTSTGGENTFVGSFTGSSNTTGGANTFIGRFAGFGSLTGGFNTFIGHSAGAQNVAGVGNVFLGRSAGATELGSNKLYIENSNSTTPLIYGEFNNDLVRINGRLAVGAVAPAEAIHIDGNMRVDNGEYQSWGPVVLHPDVDESGDAIIRFLGADGTNMFQVDDAVAKTYGPNGNQNVRMSKLNTNNDHGFLAIRDADNENEAGAFVDANGDGIVFADVKNFVMEHPEQNDKYIWYASLEGPEAGAYERGTAQLENGEVFVPFSDHFKLVANAETMTVILTPNEWDTYGLAVVKKTAEGFLVKELKGGTGNFDFDWEIKCVRKGFEDYEVIRDKSYFEEDRDN